MEQKLLFSQQDMCCGCEACANICPLHLITMIQDAEGFYYPHIRDYEKCINCNSCLNVCPVKHYEMIQSSFSEAYAGHSKDEEVSINSASGGFATVLAQEFLGETNSVVYGVSYDDDFMSVSYARVDSKDDLHKFQTSKYSQARKNDIFKRIRVDLKTNRVLFIGTPCDSYALIRYLNNTDNLFIATLICHGPTSEKVHALFCKGLENEYHSNIRSFSLRYKKEGKWKPYYIRANFDNGQEYLKKFDDTPYNTAFIYFKRPSCTTCKFKKNHFAGDILIGDYHSANPWTREYYVHGVSSMLPLTEKGKYLLEITKGSFEIMEVSLDNSIGQQAVHSPVNKKTNRSMFTKKLNSEGLKRACSIPSIRYDQLKTSIKRNVRGFLGRQKRRIMKYLKR